jgi:hypothetical protein
MSELWEKEGVINRYCIAKSGYYGNSLGSFTGTNKWSNSHYHRHLPVEDDVQKEVHIEKWKRDNSHQHHHVRDIEHTINFECHKDNGANNMCIMM